MNVMTRSYYNLDILTKLDSTVTFNSPFIGHRNGTLLGKGILSVDEGDNAFYHMAKMAFFEMNTNKYYLVLVGRPFTMTTSRL